MGIPRFFKWIGEKFPDTIKRTSFSTGEIVTPDCLYLDANGIIHNCVRKISTEVYIVIAVFAIVLVIMLTRKEKFNIPVRRSSGWGWNTGPGYGAGYGTGYGVWGVWPSMIPTRPWKNWMWGRRPMYFLNRRY